MINKLETSVDKKVSYNSSQPSNLNNKLHLNMSSLERKQSNLKPEQDYNVKNSFRPTINNNSMIIDEDDNEEFDNLNFENNRI